MIRRLPAVLLFALVISAVTFAQPADEKAASDAIRKLGVFTRLDEKAPGTPVVYVQANLGNAKKLTDDGVKKMLPQLATFKSLRGANFGGRQISDDTLRAICQTLPNLTELGLDSAVISDDGLKAVTTMKNLDHIFLNNTSITDEGVKTLSKMPTLKYVHLDKTKVTDEGMKALKSLPNLVEIRITSTDVTDAGLRELKSVKTLTGVYALKSKITKAGAAELKATLPKVYVAGP